MPSQEDRGRDFISVAVADRTRIHTQLLAEAMGTDPGLHVVAPNSRPKELLKAVERVPIDVAVISFGLDDNHDGPGLLREMRLLRPKIRGIILLDSSEPQDVLECFRAGATGVFSKHSKLEDLGKCVRCVHEGQVWANSAELGHVVEALASLPLMRATDHNGCDLLSARESEVIQYLAAGMTNREIATHLKLSHHTVKNYLFRIFDKLGVSNRTELLCLTMNNSQSREAGHGSSNDSKAAESGDPSALLRLAERYSETAEVDGDSQDRILAYMWYLLAENTAAPLLERIKQGKGRLGDVMSAPQLAEAERRAAERLKTKKRQATGAAFTDDTGRAAVGAD
jgi:DNA-binding NarL/FixJ family response regulator